MNIGISIFAICGLVRKRVELVAIIGYGVYFFVIFVLEIRRNLFRNDPKAKKNENLKYLSS